MRSRHPWRARPAAHRRDRHDYDPEYFFPARRWGRAPGTRPFRAADGWYRGPRRWPGGRTWGRPAPARWPRAFDAAPPERPGGLPERRRDRRERARERRRRRTLLERGRELFRRFREPIIGLTLAGAAAPLAKAAKKPEEPKELRIPERAREGLAPGRGPTRPGRASAELEEEVTRRLSREAQAREDTINRAITRYGISRELAEDIYDAARAERIDPRLAYGLVNTESAFKLRAVSSVGARGLTQVMPRTARWLVPGTTAEDLFDPHTNLRIGFRYLRYLLDKYDGNRRLALLAYNRGPGIVDRILARGGDPDNGYADKVLRGRV